MKTIKNLLVVKMIRYINVWLKIRNYEIGRLLSGSACMDNNYLQVISFYEEKLLAIHLPEKLSVAIDNYFINTTNNALEHIYTNNHKLSQF